MRRLILLTALIALIPALSAADHPKDDRRERILENRLSEVLADVAVLESLLEDLSGRPRVKRKVARRLADVRRNLADLVTDSDQLTRCRQVVRPTPPPVKPQPPKKPVLRPMSSAAFGDFLRSLSTEAFDKGKLRLISMIVADNHFTTAQVATVASKLSFSSKKLEAIRLMAPKILDRDKRFKLFELFAHDSEKRKLRALLD